MFISYYIVNVYYQQYVWYGLGHEWGLYFNYRLFGAPGMND